MGNNRDLMVDEKRRRTARVNFGFNTIDKSMDRAKMRNLERLRVIFYKPVHSHLILLG